MAEKCNEQLTSIIIEHAEKNDLDLVDSAVIIAEEMDMDMDDFYKQLDPVIVDMITLECIKKKRVRSSIIDSMPLTLNI